MIEISPASVRESVERDISIQRESGVDSLAVLREMRRSGELAEIERSRLQLIEYGAEQSSKLLFHTLSASLESPKPHLDHHCVKNGLCRHQDRTLEALADLLLKGDDSERAEFKRRVRAGGADKDNAIAEISQKFLENSADAKTLSEATRILTSDPKNSALREFYETAAEYMRDLKEAATKLLRDMVRRRQAAETGSIVDTFGSRHRSSDSHGPVELKESDGADPPKRGLKPEEEAARVIHHFAVDKEIAERRAKLERLLADVMRHHRIAVDGPPELREAAAISRNQDQVEADKVASELKDAEAESHWVDA